MQQRDVRSSQAQIAAGARTDPETAAIARAAGGIPCDLPSDFEHRKDPRLLPVRLTQNRTRPPAGLGDGLSGFLNGKSSQPRCQRPDANCAGSRGGRPAECRIFGPIFLSTERPTNHAMKKWASRSASAAAWSSPKESKEPATVPGATVRIAAPDQLGFQQTGAAWEAQTDSTADVKKKGTSPAMRLAEPTGTAAQASSSYAAGRRGSLTMPCLSGWPPWRASDAARSWSRKRALASL